MVYNPPIDKETEGKAVPPAAIVPVNPMRRGAYVEQAQRATVWAAVYVLGWLLMRLSCYIGLPDDCILAEEPLEVLTDLIVLLVFSLVQAWFCEIMEERRFRSLAKKYYFPGTIVIAAIAISGANLNESLSTPPGESGVSDSQVTVFVLLLIITVAFLLFHFFEAWRVLPGAQLISGQGIPRIQIQEDLLSIYLVSRGVIFAFFVLYLAFSADRSDGWGYQHYLLAWALSLFAQFKAGPSVVWLGLTTGFFLQGIGAYRINFLCDERVGT